MIDGQGYLWTGSGGYGVFRSSKVAASVDRYTETSGLLLFPSPASSRLSFRVPETWSGPIVMSITDLKGNSVLSRDYYESEEHEIELATLPNGIYILRVTDGNETISERFVVTR